MENEKDVFRFEDFVDVDKLQKMKSELLKEGILSEDGEYEEDDFDDEEIDPSMNPYAPSQSAPSGIDFDQVSDIVRISYGDSAMNNIEDFENSILYSGTKDTSEYASEFVSYLDSLATGELEQDDDEEEEYQNHFESSKSDDDEEYYKLYKDKAEEFTCDIAIEGVSAADTEVRLIVESDEWTLMFVGEVKKGQCVIPMKKLSILNEGTKGTIRLEVNADGTLFTPWEDTFVVKASKKVTVKVNESKSSSKNKKPATKKAPGVSVRVKR
jgi:hypothetical protein